VQGGCCASIGYTIVTTRQEQTRWTARQRRVAQSDGVRSPSRSCGGPIDDEGGIARACVLGKGHVVCAWET